MAELAAWTPPRIRKLIKQAAGLCRNSADCRCGRRFLETRGFRTPPSPRLCRRGPDDDARPSRAQRENCQPDGRRRPRPTHRAKVRDPSRLPSAERHRQGPQARIAGSLRARLSAGTASLRGASALNLSKGCHANERHEGTGTSLCPATMGKNSSLGLGVPMKLYRYKCATTKGRYCWLRAARLSEWIDLWTVKLLPSLPPVAPNRERDSLAPRRGGLHRGCGRQRPTYKARDIQGPCALLKSAFRRRYDNQAG